MSEADRANRADGNLELGHPDRILLEGYEMAMRMGVKMGEMPDLEAAVAAVRAREAKGASL